MAANHQNSKAVVLRTIYDPLLLHKCQLSFGNGIEINSQMLHRTASSTCSSAVQHLAVDFDAIAEAELALMEQQGVQIVLSTNAL